MCFLLEKVLAKTGPERGLYTALPSLLVRACVDATRAANEILLVLLCLSAILCDHLLTFGTASGSIPD